MGHEWLEHFLDADRLEDRLAVLKQMEGHVTQRELDCIFLSLGSAAGNRKDKNRADFSPAPSHTAAAPL